MKVLLMALPTFAMVASLACADDRQLQPDRFFVEEVWAKVGELSCLECHRDGGEAEESSFVLRQTILLQGKSLIDANRENFAAFLKMARARKDGLPKLLRKPIGELDHEGQVVLTPQSTGHLLLGEFVRNLGEEKKPDGKEKNPKPFFDGVTMVNDQSLLRRLTLSLAGRLPRPGERDLIKKDGLDEIGTVLDRVMTEDAFYERLKEGFNDIFLTNGYDGNGELILSYNHFEKSRLWYQKYDLSHIEEEKERKEALYAMTREYRKAIREEPLELIAHVVRNDLPFTEIMTSDYMMVTPYSARGYGIFERIKDRFKDPDDPFEYLPAKLPALKARNDNPVNGPLHQESKTGFYPHAGILSTFQYLRRYPTTETNRNRLRARMYYQHFLGLDVMELADQVADAAAIDSKYKTPWMEAADCVVCHRTIDPVSGLFQDFYNDEGHFGPRQDGWFKDMFVPGLEGEDLPKEEKWRSLQWLAKRTAKDPRFAIAMTEHVWYLLTGRMALRPPKDIEDPFFSARRRAYKMQRLEIAEIAKRFAHANFNLKLVFKELAKSPFYRADGLDAAIGQAERKTELHDLGVSRLLAPEQLERKIEAIFGSRWGKLKKEMEILYGGIDSKSVTERLGEPSGAMGAIQRIMANDLSCKHVVADFALAPEKRRLFPKVEKNMVPSVIPVTDLKIRKGIVHLHSHLLDRRVSVDDPEVERTFKLFASVVQEAKKRKGIDKRGTYHCGRIDGKQVDDPHYTLRAWRAVVTYLLRHQEFLYE
ncbi:DUF1592 domain-containing protein [Verrucomicrobia bacterium]|nr:DUF1592 domain-containing protein [Verrucomicrobiota bacterium]